jgi:hypothetical protein
MKTTGNRLAILAAGTLVLAAVARHGAADCGSIPFYAPALDPIDIVKKGDKSNPGEQIKTVMFDPLKVSVFEPKQRAIVLWNGTEEILLLSTDQKATQKSSVLEVIPLPAEPSVRLGSFETFEKAQKLVVEKRMWACAHGGARAGIAPLPPNAARITFQAKLGVHDVTVAEVLNSDRFVDFVQSYLQERYQAQDAPIRADFVKIIQGYMDAGFRWFAFDVIHLDGTVKSRDPVEYKFKSDKVYYPLRISSLEVGKTELDMLVFTRDGAKRFEGMPAEKLQREESLPVTPVELGAVDNAWRDFFAGETEIVLDQWKLEGESSTLLRDIAVK